MNADDLFSSLWNSLELEPPHMEFFESSARNISFAEQAIKNEYRANIIRNLLYTEILTLSRFISSRKAKYRNDKGFNSIPKIVKAVGRVYQLDLKTVTTLMKANISCKFAPSKQVGQWLMIKLLSYGLLLNRTIECCKSSVFMLNHRLRTGHSWVEITLAMAMISRIWSLATHLITKCCYSYRKLVVIQKDLPSNPKDKNWTLMNHQFPKNLKHWLDHQNCIRLFSPDAELRSELADSESSVSKDNHQVRVVNEIKKIKSSKSLKLFILNERKRRQLKKDQSLSKHLDAIQWHIIDRKLRIFYKKLNISDNEISLLNKIRKRICLWLLI